MKVIVRGSTQINCNQCGSTLEYEWSDIQEYGNETVIVCPVCGRLIKVPDHIDVNKYSTTLVDSDSITIKGVYRPYDTFVRDGSFCSSAPTISVTTTDQAYGNTVSTKMDNLTTLTSKN